MALALQAVVSLNSSGFQTGAQSIKAVASNAASAIGFAFGGATAEILTMTRAFGALGGAVAGLKQVTAVGATFEQSMANVRSVTNLASEAFKEVTAEARTMAKETKFTATEAADALFSLGSAGLDTSKSLIAALRPSLELAGATMSDTQMATEAITGTLQALKLPFTDAARAADIFAGSVAKSPLTMERLAAGLKFASPVAGAFSVELEQMVAELGAFNLVNIKAEQAGTAFRRVMIDLVKATKEGSSEVGIALRDWDVSTEGLTGAVRRLAEEGVSTEKVVEELSKRSGPALAALMKLGADAMDNLKDKMIAAGDVTRIYNIQLDTVSGAAKIFRSQMEEIGLSIFEKLKPAMRVAIEIATDFLRILQKFTRPVIITFLEMIQPLMERVKKVFVLVIDSVKEFFAAATEKVRSVIALWDDLPKTAQSWLRIVGVVTAVTVAIGALKGVILAFALKTIPTMIKAVASFGAAFFKNFVMPILAGIALAAVALASFSLGETIRNVQVGSRTIGEHMDNFFIFLVTGFENLAKIVPLKMVSMWLSIKAVFLDFGGALIDFVSQKFFGPIIEGTSKFVAGFLDAIGLEGAAEKVRNSLGGIAEKFKEFDSKEKLIETERQLFNLQTMIRDVSEDNKRRMGDAFSSMEDNAKKSSEEAITSFEEAGGSFANNISKNIKTVSDKLSGAIDTVQDGVGTAFQKVSEFSDKVKDKVAGVAEAGDGVTKTMKETGEAGEEAGASISTALDQVAEKAFQVQKAMALVGKKTEITIDIKLPQITEEAVGIWRKFFEILRFNKNLEVKVDIQLPQITKRAVEIWRGFFEMIRQNKTLDFKVDINLPKMTAALVGIWKKFFDAIKDIKKTEIKVEMDLPDITNAQVDRWIRFFKALAGVGQVDLGDINVNVKDAEISGMAADVKTIKNWLSNAKGVLWA